MSLLIDNQQLPTSFNEHNLNKDSNKRLYYDYLECHPFSDGQMILVYRFVGDYVEFEFVGNENNLFEQLIKLKESIFNSSVLALFTS